MAASLEAVSAALELIDAKFIADGVPVSRRSLKAWTLLAPYLGVKSLMHDPQRRLIDTAAPPDEWEMVQAWYTSRYGDKLNARFGGGAIAIFLRGDVWHCEIPQFWGRIRIVARPGGLADVAMSEAERLGIVNAFECIRGLTLNLQRTVVRTEAEYMVAKVKLGCEAFSGMRDLESEPLVAASIQDYLTAVEQLVNAPSSPGQSRWSSSQAVEKLMKARLARSGVVSKIRDHNLARIQEELSNHIRLEIPNDLIAQVQCPASARYGETLETVETALAAHHAALQIAVMLTCRAA